MDPSPSSPHIICFGDSLTAGYQSPTRHDPKVRETPYGGFLQEALGTKARVFVSGVCGEVTGEMVMRFSQDVLKPHPSYVIILGGTNDLGWNAEPAEIMRNLLKMYEWARRAGVEPVAITVPSLRADGDPGEGRGEGWIGDHITRRLALNRLIADYCASKAIDCVDAFTATADPKTWYLGSLYSNDGLHLTTEGYRCIAALLYTQVFAGRFDSSSLPNPTTT